jgi:hypothetical protein
MSLLAKFPGRLLASFAMWAAASSFALADSVKVLETRPATKGPGSLQVVDKRVAAPAGEFTITMVIVDPKQYRVRLTIPTDPANNGSSLASFYFDEDALAVMSAGFLRTYSPVSPAGLLKIGGETINTLSATDSALGGIACFSRPDHQLIITSRSNTQVIDASDDCIQGGPLYLSEATPGEQLEKLDSEYNSFSSRGYVRSFLAKNRRGAIVLGYSTETSLFALRSVLTMSESDGGIEAAAAIGLTGGTQSAGLVVRGTDPKQPFTKGNITTLLPDAFVVTQQSR